MRHMFPVVFEVARRQARIVADFDVYTIPVKMEDLFISVIHDDVSFLGVSVFLRREGGFPPPGL